MQDFVNNLNKTEQGIADAKTPNRSPGHGESTTRRRPQAHFGSAEPVNPLSDIKEADAVEEMPKTAAPAKPILKNSSLLQNSLKLLSVGLKAKVRRTEQQMIPIMRSRICRSLDETDLNQQKTVFLSFNKGEQDSNRLDKNGSGSKISLPKLGPPTQHVRSVSRGRSRLLGHDSSFTDDSSLHRSADINTSKSMRMVTGVLQQNRMNKSVLEASVESFGRSVLAKYQQGLETQLKQDKLFESKVRQAPGLFVAIKKKSESNSKGEQQMPKVTFNLPTQKKNREPETYSNPNDYRSAENQQLLKTIFQSPDILLKKLQKMKVGSGTGRDSKDRPMEKHESNQRIMTRIFTSEAFHSVDSAEAGSDDFQDTNFGQRHLAAAHKREGHSYTSRQEPRTVWRTVERRGPLHPFLRSAQKNLDRRRQVRRREVGRRPKVLQSRPLRVFLLSLLGVLRG